LLLFNLMISRQLGCRKLDGNYGVASTSAFPVIYSVSAHLIPMPARSVFLRIELPALDLREFCLR
jgi:hypothetical protein